MFSSSRNSDIFTTDPTFKKNVHKTFKKNGHKTSGRPREKRMIGQTEQARMMKASSNRRKTHQACSFYKMNGCRVSNCLVMKGLGAKPLEPLYVANTFTDVLGDPSKHLVEIAEAEFLLLEIGEQGLDHTSPPSGTHHLVLERCYFSSDNASAKARPSSWFGLSQQDNLSNQERKANIVEVVCLAEGGSHTPGCRFLNVGAAISGTVRPWDIVGTRDFNHTGSEVWKKEHGKKISYIKCHDVRVPIAPERISMLLGLSSIEELCSQVGCWMLYLCGFLN